MESIGAIVQDAIARGYLDLATENSLRRLLQTTKYELAEIHAFAELQQAVCEGRVRQQSREQLVAAAWQRHRPRSREATPGLAMPFLPNSVRTSPMAAGAS